MSLDAEIKVIDYGIGLKCKQDIIRLIRINGIFRRKGEMNAIRVLALVLFVQDDISSCLATSSCERRPLMPALAISIAVKDLSTNASFSMSKRLILADSR